MSKLSPNLLCLGAIHFFEKLNIGSLKIGDYLGIYVHLMLQFYVGLDKPISTYMILIN